MSRPDNPDSLGFESFLRINCPKTRIDLACGLGNSLVLFDLSRSEDQIESINESRRINAPLDRVWDIVSDVDRDSEYWKGLTSIHTTHREENLVEREVVVGFMGSKGTQRIVLKPKESVQLTLLSGPLRGSRLITLSSFGSRSTNVEISWNIEFSAVPVFAQGFVRARLEENTREALDKIAMVAEYQK